MDPISYRICARGVWDTTVPGINFNEQGVSNYAHIYDNMVKAFPRGQEGKKTWEDFVEKIKMDGKGKRYDCIIGVSGGTDSSYLLHFAKEYGLRPLAVNLDNGWSSDIAVKNIKRMTDQLGIDLETYVINYEEVKDILLSFLKAGLPWADTPTDQAIKAILYKKAAKENLKYVLNGHDFRSEGFQPNEWTYCDGKQLTHVHKKFGMVRRRSFPVLMLTNLLYYSIVRRIRMVKPFFYVDYSKEDAKTFLQKEYGWEYYGGHHHENIYTRFIISYWLKEKFGIDKRIITFSAQVMNNEISREYALEQLKKPPYDPIRMDQDKDFVIKKLGITPEEFEVIWKAPNTTFMDYPSYYPMMNRMKKLTRFVIKITLPNKPLMLFQMEGRNGKK
ncbi:MAG: N-acetyl sugar amidotransferase [Lentimicrobium sp.]